MVHSTSCLTIWGNLNETSSFNCILRDKHWRNSHTLKFSTKSLTFPCLICPWTYILLKIALKSKIVMKRKNLSRFLEPQKVAPNAKSFCTWHGSRYVTGVSYRTPPNRVPPIWRPPMTQSLLISKRTWYNSQDENVEEDVDQNIYSYFSQNVAHGFSYNATPQLQHNVCERRRWAPNGKLNNLPSGFPFSNHTNFGDFALLFCKGRAELLFCPVCLLYCHVLVGVTIMVCLRFLMRKNRVVDRPCPFKISL